MNRYLNYIILIIIAVFIGNKYIVYAEECDKDDIARLKELAKIVDVSYEYLGDVSKGLDDPKLDTYKITLSNFSDELVLYDDEDTIEYDSTFVKDGVLSFEFTANDKSNFKFYLYSSNCSDYNLRTIDVVLPKYNVYSKSKRCNKNKKYNLDVCKQFYIGTVNDRIFVEAISKYSSSKKSKFDVVDFILNHLYIVIGVTFLLVVAIVLFIIRWRKRSVLE